MPLTDTECKNAKCPEGKPYQRFADGGGLYLEVTATGSKLWRWKYRYGGKEKRLALRIYPEVPLASPKWPAADGCAVKGARTLRDEARALLEKGIDPGEARREAKRSALVASDTAFEAVARQWWKTWRTDKTERHAGYMLRRHRIGCLPCDWEQAGRRVRGAYNHAQYLDERRELMQSCADYLDAVKQTGKVIPFRQGRGYRVA